MILEFSDKDTKNSYYNFIPYVQEARGKMDQFK